MRVLYLYNMFVPWERDHIFIRNVWYALKHRIDAEMLNVVCSETDSAVMEYFEQERRWVLNVPEQWSSDYCRIKSCLVDAFRKIKPDIIHSNIIEGYDIEAAKDLSIPIVSTIHIGAVVCPRHQAEGFLDTNDNQCTRAVDDGCMKCMYQSLPLPWLANTINSILPDSTKNFIRNNLKRQVFYLSPVLMLDKKLRDYKHKIKDIFPYTTFICANDKLKELLATNALDNAVVIPHGIPERRRLQLPAVRDKVVFYYAGRFQYAKGVHKLLHAFDGIPTDRYELHLLGEVNTGSRQGRAYEKELHKLAKGKSVFFEGSVDYDKLEEKIKDYHVMIHPAMYHEVYGLAIAEALSMGRPVLSTKCGGPEMQINDNVNGWLVPSNDVAALRSKILDIINNPGQICDCSHNAVTPHPLNQYTENLIKLYEDKIHKCNNNNTVCS